MNLKPLVVIFEAAGELQADMLGAMLTAEGIAYHISQEGAGRVYGLTLGRLGRVQVLVKQIDAKRAAEIVRDFQKTLQSDETQTPDEKWDSEWSGDITESGLEDQG